MKEPNVCKLNFLVLTRLQTLQIVLLFLQFPPLPPPPQNSYMVSGNERILPQRNKIRATEQEKCRAVRSHGLQWGPGKGGVSGLRCRAASTLHWSPKETSLDLEPKQEMVWV